MRHSDELARWESVGRGEAREQKPWRRGSEIFEEATRQGTIVPVIFSAAEATAGLIYYGPLERVDVDEDQTSYAVGRVHALPEAYPLSSLILESTGEPLSDSYIRPYAVCQTPALLPRPEEEPPPQPAVSPPSTRLSQSAGSIS